MAALATNRLEKGSVAAAEKRFDGKNFKAIATHVLRIFSRPWVTFAVALRVSTTREAFFTMPS